MNDTSEGASVGAESAPAATVFRFEPRPLTGRKQAQLLCRSDLMVAAIQTVGDGGETNLHMHKRLDGFWFVLSGRATFYTTGDEVIAELGPREGVLVPRGFPYWFERTGDEHLEILQVEASSALLRNMDDVISDRVDIATSADILERQGEVQIFGSDR
ncbi:MAG: cupin domain-containing protein [Acidimicrobiia bacterium]